ncbi:MAG: dehydrogenase [Gammaproteobacteria bacterium]|nr:dehydrogenase [Gammaproteobacteria bacterium]
MAYLLLIIEPRGQRAERTLQEGQHAYAQMVEFSQSLQARGVLKAVESLQSDAQGVRVSLREGKRTLRDGPFAEAKEMVGGFFLLDCATREQAIAFASECPAASWATVEVREVGPCFIDEVQTKRL